jgi:hypothetical protein
VKHHLGLTFQATFETTGNRSVPAASGYTEDISAQSYLFGPTFRYGVFGGKASLFFQALFGATHNSFNLSVPADSSEVAFCYTESTVEPINPCSSKNFTVATGGGVDIRLMRHIAVRPVQMEYWTEQIPYSVYEPGLTNYSEKDGVDGFRYSAGAVFNF